MSDQVPPVPPVAATSRTLADALEAWQRAGQPADGVQHLRALAAACAGMPKEKGGPVSPAERHALAAIELYRVTSGGEAAPWSRVTSRVRDVELADGSRHMELTSPQDGERLEFLGPFLADKALGATAYHDLDAIGDADLRIWLAVAAYAHAPSPEMIAFVDMALQTIRRETWVPAARAIAQLASRDATCRDRLQRYWLAHYPAELPSKWGALLGLPSKGGKGQAEKDEMAEPLGGRHMRRHMIATMCAWKAADASAPFDVAHFVQMALPKDSADASATLIAYRHLLDGAATRELAIPHLARRAQEAPREEQVDTALRRIAEQLYALPETTAGAHAALTAVLDRLIQANWRAEIDKIGLKAFDLLVSTSRTLRWLAVAGPAGTGLPRWPNHLERAIAGTTSLEREWALLVTQKQLPGWADDFAELSVGLLAKLFDPNWIDTVTSERRALTLAMALEAFEHADVRELPWARLVARAGRTAALTEWTTGRVADAARTDLARYLQAWLETRGHQGSPSAVLLRDVPLDAATVRRLAGMNGFVANQVAVQVDRQLRLEPHHAARVHLLWQLLAANPSAELFEKLKECLRAGSPYRELVAWMAEFSQAKAQLQVEAGTARTDGDAQLRSVYCELKLAGLLAPADVKLLGDLQACLRQPSEVVDLGPLAEKGPAGRLEFRQGWADGLVQTCAAVDNWLDVLRGKDKGDARIAGIAESLREQLRLAIAALPAPTDRALQDLALQLQSLEKRCAEWPEGALVGLWLPSAKLAQQELTAKVEKSREARAQLEPLLASADETALASAFPADRIQLLPGDDAKRLHRFWLDRLEFRRAAAIRLQLAGQVQLPSWYAYFAPMFAGILSGPLLMLDVGGNWNELLGAPGGQVTVHLWVTSAVALGAAFLLMTSMIAQRLGPTGSRGAQDRPRWWAVASRTLPSFGGAVVLAVVAVALVLTSLEGTSIRGQANAPYPFVPQVALWASLSLFLGIFIGLVAQGRSAAGEGKD
jgi:hypothetical protein